MTTPATLPDSLHQRAGTGGIHLQTTGSSASFTELSATYPLKLLSPRIEHPRTAIVYILSYGGGLVGGDRVQLNVQVDEGAYLLALTQGSTKVFKQRSGSRAAASLSTSHSSPEGSRASTFQKLTFSLQPNSLLLLLPDPVACFKDASYNQIQHFTLHDTSSLALLDWVTSGRRAKEEDWSFARYYSANTVVVGDTTIARDVMRLESSDNKVFRSLTEKLAPYGCYATLLLRGPLVQTVIDDLTVKYKAISVFKKRAPDPLIWSLSLIAAGAAVVRIAGLEVEEVKSWLRVALEGIKEHVGEDAFRRAFV